MGRQAEDEATDTPYYFNTWSQETRWSKPFEMVLSEKLLKAATGDMPPGWVRRKEPKVKLHYYYNEAKNEFRWEPPAAKVKQVQAASLRAKLYDSAWFDRQNKHDLAARARKTRAIGFWEERKDPETGASSFPKARGGATGSSRLPA
jgi:hypothetical protein